MAHGYLTPTDIRSDRNYLGAIAGAIGSRIKKSSNMAARERAYASKQAEAGGTSLEEAGIGRGYFFKRALGSSFGGDRIARTRGRFETDPGPGRDPSGTQASRFRGGFDYGVSNSIKSPTGGALANIVSPGGGGFGGGAAGFPGSGSTVINPDVLGGAMVQSQYRATTPNSNVSIDTTATEVKDLAGILNQIGQIIVSSSNSTIQAVDSVQQVNVQVIEGIKSLGQLQARIADRQIREQKQIAAAAEQNQMIMMSRLLSAQEARNFTEDDFSGNLTAEKGYGFGGKGGGFIGGLMSRLSDFFGMRMGFGGGGGGFRAPGGAGGATRGGGMLGGASRALGANRGSMVNRMGGNFLARNATRMFGRGGLMPVLRPIFKRIPIFGGLIDFAVSLALGEPVGRAAAKAVGATLGAGLGSLIPVPGVGTIAGGILGDFAGGAIYDAIAGGGENKETVPQLAGGARITGSKDGVLVRVGEGGAGKDELVKPLNKKVFEQEEQTRLDVQFRNRKRLGIIQSEGLKHYYEKEDGWTVGWRKFTDWIKKLGGAFSRMLFGDGNDQNNENPYGRSPNEGLFNRRSRGLSGTAFTGSAAAASPILETFLPTAQGGRPATLTAADDGSGTTTNFNEKRGNRRHQGVDIGTDVDQKVLAIEEGTVVDAYPTGYGKYGGAVVVEHADKTRYVYGHITPSVKKGDTLKPGDHLGNVVYYPGPNGQDYTHLHLERINAQDKKVDAISHLMGQENLTGPNREAEEAPSVTPENPPTARPTGELSERIMSSRSALLNTMRTFDAQSQNAKPFANRDAKSKGEKLSIPGVGSIVKDRGLIGDWFNKFFNASGKPISEKEFYDSIENQRVKNQSRLKQFNEALNLDPDNKTIDPWASASANTGNGILKASADVSANASKPSIIYLNNSTQQQQSGGSSDPGAVLAAMGSASSSPRSWTPAGFHNAILDA